MANSVFKIGRYYTIWTMNDSQYSNAYITNIRLYNTSNTEIDKQLTDLVSYNIRNNSNAIINDSADTYLNKEYKGRQR
jgi:hypothetical protein